jgi:multicomponent Na+:H+ antiporter subunit F
MNSFLFVIGIFILATIAGGLIVMLQRSNEVDRIMAAQLLGTGGAAILLILAIATETSPIVDVALMLALFAAFATVTLVRDAPDPRNTAKGQ